SPRVSSWRAPWTTSGAGNRTCAYASGAHARFGAETRGRARRVSSISGTSQVEQGVDELARVELPEVVDPLPHADVADGKAELGGDGDHDPPLGGAVELGEDDPGHVERLHEGPRLRETVLAGRRVECQQGLVRRTRDLPRDHPSHLLQLLHQVAL